ncbi:MAG: Kdo hydroxylase family protein [Gammaproteobacteria bacterium]
MDKIYRIDADHWDNLSQSDSARESLEKGQVLLFPKLSFHLSDEEKTLLTPDILQPKKKNISLSKDRIKNAINDDVAKKVKPMMHRFSNRAKHLVEKMLPEYSEHMVPGRTSFRPVNVVNRKMSVEKDDTRLHVDSFPATPVHGKRILRVFSNVNAKNQPRTWRIGEPFEKVVERFLPKAKSYSSFKAGLLNVLQLTKTKRSAYDHYMTQIHDLMKQDDEYQMSVDQITFDFPAQTTWIVFTDQVSHAAMSGQHLLEQTFYLPAEVTQNSPFSILETQLHKNLVSDIMG